MYYRIFHAADFTPTTHSSAEDKAKFANHFVRFVKGNFNPWLFHKWFYQRLSMTFGHIAHYNCATFYATWFEADDDRRQFLRNIAFGERYGQPEFTYVDVERALADWLRENMAEEMAL